MVKDAVDEPDGAVIESHVPQASAEDHTSRMKFWVALGAVPLAAVMVMGYTPEVPAAGVPETVAVLPPLLTKETPEGRAPVSVKVIGVVPVAATVKLPLVPTAKLVELALVKAGAVAANAVPRRELPMSPRQGSEPSPTGSSGGPNRLPGHVRSPPRAWQVSGRQT